jgi:hypothetical protein
MTPGARCLWTVPVPLLVVAALAAGGAYGSGSTSGPAPQHPPAQLPARAVPPAAAAEILPLLDKHDLDVRVRAAFRRALGWSDDCEGGFDAVDPGYGGVEVERLTPGRYLIGVVCARGAYQGSRIYYDYDVNRPVPVATALTFETRESPDETSLVRSETRELWGLPEFDRRRRQLRVWNKFRGLGDCGLLAVYRFVEAGPELVELRAKTACDGKGAGTPERWPRVPLR